MSDSWLILALKVKNRAAGDTAKYIQTGSVGTTGRYYGRQAITGVTELLDGAVAGVPNSVPYLTVLADDGTYSTGNIACTRANAAGNYVRFTYGTLTITLTEGTDFLRGASDTTCAANLATAINDNVVLGGLMTALGSSGNCGLTAKVPTALIQDIALSTDDGTAFSFTQLTGAAEGTAQFFPQAFALNTTP